MILTPAQIKQRFIVAAAFLAVVVVGFGGSWYLSARTAHRVAKEAAETSAKQLRDAVKQSVDNQNRGFEDLRLMLKAIQREVGPENQNTGLDFRR